MQTITRIEEDTYIMKNYEFLFKAGYFAVYFMINLLNMFSMIFSNTSYKYGYVILIFSSLLLFLLKKYVFKKLLFIFKKDKLEIQEIWSNKLIKKIEPTEDRDMDFIVDAQDIFIEWLDSIKVKKINSKRYNVYLFNFYDNRYDSIQLKVAKKKDRYIIDDIIF